jgi:hypothetical protein
VITFDFGRFAFSPYFGNHYINVTLCQVNSKRQADWSFLSNVLNPCGSCSNLVAIKLAGRFRKWPTRSRLTTVGAIYLM